MHKRKMACFRLLPETIEQLDSLVERGRTEIHDKISRPDIMRIAFEAVRILGKREFSRIANKVLSE